ncbi:MAG: hypothetical protein KDK26_06370 [Roseivivax sp.]|nr:hypothetical protein [Roseivivax sp.]
MSSKRSFSTLIKPQYLKVVRSLGYALTLGDADAWIAFSQILVARLADQERAAVAYAALMSLDDPATALAVAETVLGRGTGIPVAPFSDLAGQAAYWADMADADELEAYCMAIFNRLEPDTQAAFVRYVQTRAAA